MFSFFIGVCVLYRNGVPLQRYWLIWIETVYDTLQMLFLHSVFVFRVFLFTEWEQRFPSLIIHFFMFSDLTLVNNSVLHEDIHPQMCSVLFVGFILIFCIPVVPHSSSPSLLHWEGKWWYDVISLLHLLYSSLPIVFSLFLFRFSSFSFPSHTSFIHILSF